MRVKGGVVYGRPGFLFTFHLTIMLHKWPSEGQGWGRLRTPRVGPSANYRTPLWTLSWLFPLYIAIIVGPSAADLRGAQTLISLSGICTQPIWVIPSLVSGRGYKISPVCVSVCLSDSPSWCHGVTFMITMPFDIFEQEYWQGGHDAGGLSTLRCFHCSLQLGQYYKWVVPPVAVHLLLLAHG